MNLNSLLISVLAGITLVMCNSDSENKKKDFSMSTNAKNKVISVSDNLSITIKNPKNFVIDSIQYSISGKPFENNSLLTPYKLGKHQIEATVYYKGSSQDIMSKITILNDKPPKVFSFEILNEYPHDITSYTQGLEFYNGKLYESTGQKGRSKLRRIDYETGTIEKNIDLSREYFGEGLTVLADKMYQLTWHGGIGFVYDVESFERRSSFKYGQSKEGWGLCNDGTILYKSDGTEKIWFLDPDKLSEIEHIQAYTNKGKIVGLNELEWIEGRIYANRYQKNGVAIINPTNGAIEGVVDFSSLRKKVKQHPKLDVLNGIAYNPLTKTIFVTGKNWDTLFEVNIKTQ